MAIEPNSGLNVDVDRFFALVNEFGDAGVDEKSSLAKAAEIYTADFMAGFHIEDSPVFEEWRYFQALRLQEILTGVLDNLVDWHSRRGELDEAIAYGRRQLALDPIHEPFHRQLMSLYGLAGRWSAAARQYEECVRLLKEELGVGPESETLALYDQILTRRIVGSEPDDNTQSQLLERVESLRSSPPTNLPPQRSGFIGRDQELEDLDNLLAHAEVRLVTIIGGGGMGKTRLALASAERQARRSG